MLVLWWHWWWGAGGGGGGGVCLVQATHHMRDKAGQHVAVPFSADACGVAYGADDQI